MGDVQTVRGDAAAASFVAPSAFVEVVNTATGQTAEVPRDWVGNPVLLSDEWEKSLAQKIADGEVEQEKLADPPTESDTKQVIADYAKTARIDLGDAKTKAEMVAVIQAALATAPDAAEPAVSTVSPDPGVQLAGPVETEPLIPSLRSDFQPPNEPPATGDKE
jgi:hypothetical protein